MGATRPDSKLHKEQKNSGYATCSTHPEPNLDGTVKHRMTIARLNFPRVWGNV